MKTSLLRRLLAAPALAACLLAALAAMPAHAQPAPRPLPPVDAAVWQGDTRGHYDAGIARQPAVEDALRAHGFRSDRLTRQQTRALEETHRDLFPDHDPRRQRLNRTQASALVYMALVHPLEAERGRGARAPGRGCESTALLVYDLGDLLTEHDRARSIFLSREEQQRLRDGAAEVQRAAVRCGNSRLADEASRLGVLASERMVERDRALRQIRSMKGIARQDLAGRF
jgi:hypothetical protein